MEKHYDFHRQEPAMQDFWEQHQIYRFDPHAKGKIYSIDTPPPTVSGSLHIGHLFSYTQAEVIARFHRMQGDNVYYPFGFDDNGLPTERLVEREQGVRARDLPRREFIEKCRKTSAKYEEDFRKLFRSLGLSADFSLSYSTASPEVQKLSQALFLELARQGKAECREAPVLWCTECRTSIAQAELDTKEAESVFYTLPFLCGDDVLPVATTRPELLFGCVCLFVHPENETYRSYLGRTAKVPLYGFEIPILPDEKADPEKGTGIVMCATFGDSTDAQWVEEHKLPIRRVLLPDGTFDPSVPHLAGLTVRQGRQEIVRLLEEAGLLLRREPVTHTVAIHERCGTEVEILPSRQWYIRILPERENLLRAAEEIRWHPAQMKERYLNWVENLKWDWCISRQRYYGVPFPVWYCKSCGKPVFADTASLPIDPMETPYEGTCSCGCTAFVPETAVLDTWATSSVTPLLHKSRGLESPMSMRTHAHEIIRTWTFYSIVRSLFHTGKLPWKDLMITGFVLAKKGEKISKSKGNGADPSALIGEHSADALRLWTATARLGTDSFFSPADLQPEKRFLIKLWNAARFASTLLEDFSLKNPPANLLPADSWLLARRDETYRSAAAYLEQYEMGQARREIDRFFWNDFCDTYIELVKDRLYSPEKYGEPLRKAAQHTLYSALFAVLQLYAPFAPHITETIYQELFRRHHGEESLHLTRWPKPDASEETLLRFGEQLKENLSAMRREKTEHGLSLRAELDCFTVRAEEDLFPLFRASESDLLACARAKRLELTERN